MWIEKESMKRTAFFAFVMDAQHASIFGHTPNLSISDMHIPLPSTDALWRSPNPSAWARERARTEPSPPFLSALRALLARQPTPASFSPFARFVLLHGLYSIAKHMQDRDLTASHVGGGKLAPEQGQGSISPSGDEWKENIDRAVETWSLSLLTQQPALCLEAGRPLQRLAHVTIYINIIDFHIFAGAPSLSGVTVTEKECARAEKRIKAWTERPSAKRSLSHCLLLIQEIMFTRRKYRATEDNIALRPWCLYQTTLVLWAYGMITEGRSAEPQLGAEEYLVQMLSGLMGGTGRVKGANRTSGLLSSVRAALEGCRWELLQEARTTLEKMILNSVATLPTPGPMTGE